MSYTLSKLGAGNFEHLVQSLCKKILGEGVSIFGSGPDGQREATFQGRAPYPSEQECWDGYWVIQAKFKEPNTKTADYLWLKTCFEDEMGNFQTKKNVGKKIPDNYLFFTNIVLTPQLEKGIKDKIDALAKNYNNLIPNIHVIGADDINRFLEGHRDIAVSYASYILSGDILSYLYKSIQETNRDRQNAFHRYLYQAFCNDYCSRMEQAGQVTEEKVSIDKVYIDLTFKDEDTQVKGKFIDHAISIGNQVFRFSSLDSKQKDANMNNLPLSTNKYVLKGTAGQGKSTVCQFLAQIYRASFIQNFSNLCDNKVLDFLNRVQIDGIQIPTCYRVPVRIELRLYSSWIANRQKEKKQYDLVTYISTMIGDISSSKFDNETLRLYFNKYAWAFFFDGLDEVPESSNRKEVMAEIETFINIDLRQADTDAIFYATTRPEGYVGEFNNVNFNHLDLMPLDRENCFIYLNKLLTAIENDSVKRKEYLKILEQGWDNRQIAFMMQTPLQVTIITILVKSGGEPPRDKFSLFKEYFEIIIKREKQKGMGTILNDNQDLIEGIYYLLGYELQKRSVSIEGSDALISLDDMCALIKLKLSEDGITEDTESYQELLSGAYSMIVNRINFASEISEGYIGFSIRSMQEFLAAVYIVRNVGDKTLGSLLKELAKSSYWKNTFIFVVECIAKEKIYYLDFLIDTILGELNGKDLPIDNIDTLSCVHYGSQVAFNLLSNNIFKNKPKYENKLCKYISEYCELQYLNDIAKIPGMSDNVKKELAQYLISKSSLTKADCIIASLLVQDDSSSLLLKEYCEIHAVQIAKEFFGFFNNVFPKQIYNLVLIALQSGELLQLDLYQIIAFIDNSNENHSDEIKQTLFKITIRALLDRQNAREVSIDSINEYFEGNLTDISNYSQWFEGEENDLTEDITVGLPAPFYSKNDFIDLISLCDRYNCTSMSIILKTITSKNIDDYSEFINQISIYAEEIKLLNEDMLIRENSILYLLWLTIIDKDRYSKENILNNILEQKLSDATRITDIAQLLKEHETVPTIYSVRATHSNNVFTTFYAKVKEIYTTDEIIKFPEICFLIEFLFYCQFRHEQISGERQLNTTLIDDVFEYSKFDTRASIWQRQIWLIAFLKLSVPQILKHGKVSFDYGEEKQIRYNLLSFSEDDQIIILNKILTYICASGNESAFDFLFKFILSVNDFNVISNINFDLVKDYHDERIACLKAMKFVNGEKGVVTEILPLLENEHVQNFIYHLISNINMPSHFAPLYLYFLKDCRKKGAQKDVYMLERKLVEYITITPVDGNLLDF